MYIIGISGGSASGKSTLVSNLVNHYHDPSKVSVIPLDDYYKDQSHKTMEERVVNNYDHPDAFDFDLLCEHLKMLKNNEKISKPIYDFTQHNRSTNKEDVLPGSVLIVEGLFTLEEESIRNLCDLLVYVDCQDDIRFIRRLKRDVAERGRSVESVCDQYLNTVKPMHDAYIEPSKKYADIIIGSDFSITEATNDLLISKIDVILNKV